MKLEHDLWPRGWQQHEQQQLERQARLSLDEKLQWLEDAHKMVLQLQQSATSSTRSEQKEQSSQ